MAIAPSPPEPTQPYDLVVKGGTVVDPSQALHGRRDLAIRFGRVAALAPEIPAADAQRVIDAAGLLVTPGLIDLHAHTGFSSAAFGLLPLLLLPFRRRKRSSGLRTVGVAAGVALLFMAVFLTSGCGTTPGGTTTQPQSHQVTSSAVVTLTVQ